MTENNESTTMEDQHVVIDLAVDSVELLSTRPSIGAARAEYIVRLREQGNLNLATLAHTTRLSEPFYQNLMEKNLIRPVPSTSPITDIDEGSTASDKSISERDESKLWMVGMRERTDAKFAEMHERMGNSEANSKRLEVKVDQNHAHMQQQVIDITTMEDHRDEDAKIRERKLNDTMKQLDIKIQRLKQAAAEDLRRTKEEWQKEIDGVGSRTDRWEQVQSDQTRAICELQTSTQGDHRDSNHRLQQLKDGISTVSPAMVTAKESPESIGGIYRIPDRGDIEATAFECLESGATSPNRSHASDHDSLQSLHEGAAWGQGIQDNLQSSKLQGIHHRETNSRLQQLEDRIATVSTARISPKESLGSIKRIYRIPDRAGIEMTAFECLESGATSPSRSHASDHASLQSLHEGAAGGQNTQDNLHSSKLQGGTPDNNRPRWMSDLIDSLPDGNVYTGGKGNVDPKIRGQRYQYEEVPTPNTKIQTGIDRSEHLPPPPYRSHDPMTSGRLSSPAPKRLPPNPHEHSYERPQSTGVADGALHDKNPAGIKRGLTTHLPDRDNSYDLAPDVRPRSQASQPQTHVNIVANEGSRDPVVNSDSRLGYHPPAPDNLRRPQLGIIRDRRDVVQATGDRQYPSLQGQYRGHQPHKVRQYPDQDDVNNHHIPSHDPDRVDDANGDHNHQDPYPDIQYGRGHQRNKEPQLHHTGHRQGSHHRDPNPDMQYCSSGDGLSSSEDESIADKLMRGRRPRNRSKPHHVLEYPDPGDRRFGYHPPVSDNQLVSTHDHHDKAGRRSRQIDRGPPPHGDVGHQNDPGAPPHGDVGCQIDRGSPPHGDVGRQKDRASSPDSEVGRQRDRGPSPDSEVGRQRDRGPSPDSEVGRQRDRGPSPDSEVGRQRDRGPSPNGDVGHQRDRGPPPDSEVGRQRERGPSPDSEVGHQRDRGPSPDSEVGRQRDRGPSPNGDVGHQRDRGPPPNGDVGHQRDRGQSPNGNVGHQRDRGPSPNGDVGHQRDRGLSPDGEVGCQGDQGPPSHGDVGHQNDRGPPPHGGNDTRHEIPLGSGGEGSSSSDDEDVADRMILGMNRPVVGKLETRFIGESADRVYGNVTDGYLEAGGGMVQNVTVDHFLTVCGDRRATVVADVNPTGTVSQSMRKVGEMAHGGSLFCHVVFKCDYMVSEVRPETRNSYLRLSPPQLQHGCLVVSPPVTDASETPENKSNTSTGLSNIPLFQNELQQLKGETVMYYAAELTKTYVPQDVEDADKLTLLLLDGGYINSQTKETHETPLHYCSRAVNTNVHLEIFKHIGPSTTQQAVSKQVKHGWSPQAHLEIGEIMLKHHVRVYVFDDHGNAVLHLAGENGHEGVVDVILWHRTFVNNKSQAEVIPLHLTAENCYKVLAETRGRLYVMSLARKTPPLHMAAQKSQIEVCNMMFKMKADANATDVHVLKILLNLASENYHSDVVSIIVKYHPELVTLANTSAMTCTQIAASIKVWNALKDKVSWKVTITKVDFPALHVETHYGQIKFVREMLTKVPVIVRSEPQDSGGGDASNNDTGPEDGYTPLHLTSQVEAHYGQIKVVREMLTKVPWLVRSEPQDSGGGDASNNDTRPEDGYTPLHLTSQSGHEGLLCVFLNSPGVPADTPNIINGSIPLHLEAQDGHTGVVNLLSKSTNQLLIKAKRGHTGIHLAASNGHHVMVSLLLVQGADVDVYNKRRLDMSSNV